MCACVRAYSCNVFFLTPLFSLLRRFAIGSGRGKEAGSVQWNDCLPLQ